MQEKTADGRRTHAWVLTENKQTNKQTNKYEVVGRRGPFFFFMEVYCWKWKICYLLLFAIFMTVCTLLTDFVPDTYNTAVCSTRT